MGPLHVSPGVKVPEHESQEHSYFVRRLFGLMRMYEVAPREAAFINNTLKPLLDAECQAYLASMACNLPRGRFLLALRCIETIMHSRFQHGSALGEFCTVRDFKSKVEGETITFSWKLLFDSQIVISTFNLIALTDGQRHLLMESGRRPIEAVNEYFANCAPTG